MWKIIAVSLTLLSLQAMARPSYVHEAVVPEAYEEHIEYAPAVIGHEVHSLPTAVSHQSQTVIHEKRPYLRPIRVKATYAAPLIKSYAPIVKTYAPVATAAAYPVAYSPLAYSGLYDHGWTPGYRSVYSDWGAWPWKK